MTSPELFKSILKDPLLQEKYKLSKEKLERLNYHEPSGIEIIEAIKLVISGIEYNTPDSSINSQIKSHFNI